jgi:hypothetical protein
MEALISAVGMRLVFENIDCSFDDGRRSMLYANSCSFYWRGWERVARSRCSSVRQLLRDQVRKLFLDFRF